MSATINRTIMLRITEERFTHLEQTAQGIGSDLKSFLEEALTFYEWAIDETRKGGTVGFMDSDCERFTKVKFEPLERVLDGNQMYE